MIIKHLAYKILSAANVTTSAPDIFYICNFLKINVVSINFKTTFPTFNNYHSYTLFENQKRVIYLEKNLNPIQQRILLAHCLGHHFLGHTEKGSTFLDSLNNDYLPKNFTQLEINANIFAQHLLTPEELVKVVFLKANSFQEFADFFHVTETFAIKRLQSLNLISKF